YGADIRMIQSRGRLCFAFEALAHLAIIRQLLRQKLQSYLPPEHLQILCLKHFPHAAFAQKAHDLKVSTYDGTRSKTLAIGNLNHWLAQKAARLLVIPQKLLDLLSQIVLSAHARQESFSFRARPLQNGIEHSLGP